MPRCRRLWRGLPDVKTGADDAAHFVGACRYPPMGYRSLGPIRAQIYGGMRLRHQSQRRNPDPGDDRDPRAGWENLDAILKVEGRPRRIYIGPADLSLSLGLPGRLDPVDPKAVAAMDTILAKCKAAGLRCGVSTPDRSRYARNMVKKGYDLVTILATAASCGGPPKPSSKA